ncbi:Peptidase family M23 [Reichenbachiella agariperforans]|uniref:Peptidase family M23 n=1 Tax=Reichenbachiella agariperforans TaxID=156994 RepID=A0A1M6WKK9_REIAG|nr:M23 family metallopeptidase [Reichenbachiella agariperforans]SHK94257.1 Peptidase family M23 [Reichenbachiella agariperforans]
MRLSSIVTLLLLASINVSAQSPKRGDFIFPVRPKQENYLAGTMGELRSTHFHSGIDIKTSGITGLPIYAAADGYVERVRVSTSGYGNALYIAHPHNNSVTVYAHLERFSPEIAAYVRDKQYALESFDVNLFPDKGQFAFKQGDEVAKSGNSGSSSGPHLHFEIRDKAHKILDPLDFGFDEIVDNIAPTVSKVAFVTMDDHARVNGLFGRFEFNVQLDKAGNPVINEPLSLFGNIGVEVYVYDQLDGARNKNGVRHQTLTLDNELIFQQDIATMEFHLQRNILVHTNYKRSSQGGRRFNKYYVDAGNELTFYETNNLDGVMRVMDLNPHHLDIRLEDSYGNLNQYRFTINGSSDDLRTYQLAQSADKPAADLHRGFLELKTDLTDRIYCEAKVYVDSTMYRQQMSYDVLDQAYYIWDMRYGMPDSVEICDQMQYFDFVAKLPKHRAAEYEGETCTVRFSNQALFDQLFLRYQYVDEGGAEYFQFGNEDVPLRKYVEIELKPSLQYDVEKSAVYSVSSRGSLSYMGGEWEQGTVTFRTRDLVNYTVATDSVAPLIKPLRSKYSLRFLVTDDMSGIGEIRAELNGKWLLMNYDAKRNLIWSDEKSVVIGELKLVVTDNSGNIATYERRY